MTTTDRSSCGYPRNCCQRREHAQETYLCFALQNNRNSWAGFYRYVKWRKGNRVNIPMIKDRTGEPVTDPVEMANNLNNYYASLFSHERDIPDITASDRYEPFSVKANTFRKRLGLIHNKKSVGPDDIPGVILKLGGEAMIPYLT